MVQEEAPGLVIVIHPLPGVTLELAYVRASSNPIGIPAVMVWELCPAFGLGMVVQVISVVPSSD